LLAVHGVVKYCPGLSNAIDVPPSFFLEPKKKGYNTIKIILGNDIT